jgi:hypothetical protein
MIRVHKEAAMTTKSIKYSLVLFTVLVAGRANAGGISDGGGKGVVCRDANQKITFAQTLDVYEGRAFWELTIPEVADPYPQQVDTALRKLETAGIGPQIRHWTEIVQRSLKILPPGDKLVEINDSLQSIIPKCPVEQLANFFNTDHIVVSGDIWNHLGETDKAALVLHEALYYYDRDTGVKDSRRARRITAHLLSEQNIFVENPMEGVNTSTVCYTVRDGIRDARTLFYVYPDGAEFKIQFAILEGEQKLFKTTAKIRALNGRPDFDNSRTTTDANFEGGDTIRFWSETRVTKGKVETFHYMDGLSGWLPGKHFPKREVRCLTMTN